MGDKVFDKIICGYTQATTTTKDSTTERERERGRKGKGEQGRGCIASGKLSHKEKFAQTNLKKIIITRTVSQNVPVPVPVPVRHRLHKFYSGCDRG